LLWASTLPFLWVPHKEMMVTWCTKFQLASPCKHCKTMTEDSNILSPPTLMLKPSCMRPSQDTACNRGHMGRWNKGRCINGGW
jgi:hypothetical protein